MVVSWIQRSISDNISQSFLWIDHAHAFGRIWRPAFFQGDIFKIPDFQNVLTNLNQVTLDVSTYFTNLNYIWEHIDSFLPTRDCTCVMPCTSGATFDLHEYKYKDNVIKFRKGLTNQFLTVHSQILLLDPLPPLDITFSMVLGQERPSTIPISNYHEHSLVMHFQPSKNSRGARGHNSFRARGCGHSNSGHGSTSHRVCTHCGRTNHTVETCFMKHENLLGYHYKSQKPFINNATSSTHIEVPTDSPVDSQHSIATIQNQYIQILQILQHQQFTSITLTPFNGVSIPHVNYVSTFIDGKPHLY
ncbi:uncharacterized protein LOC127136275 [Lathyrus oleraceus]|uniref:uncharacterized protein LOC127136275 n=1 Tax=Pisum sativum TaxID=3888 RepID=UPI0021D32A7C|nr:uncharacterized protein LOC127136275 [Pisum sativum]